MMATAPESREPEFMSRAAPYRQRRLLGHDRMGRLVSLAAVKLAMSFENNAPTAGEVNNNLSISRVLIPSKCGGLVAWECHL
jgi:hypothetical protein